MSFQAPAHLTRRVSISFVDSPSMTEQSHQESCDIHNIMRKYKQTGVIEHVAKHGGTYGDFINALDFKEAQDRIAEAQSMFESVPAHIRADFKNDPAAYIEFMTDPANREAIESYGLDASHLPDMPSEALSDAVSDDLPSDDPEPGDDD